MARRQVVQKITYVVVGTKQEQGSETEQSSETLAKELNAEVIPFTNLGDRERKKILDENIVINYGRWTKHADLNPLSTDKRWTKAEQSDILFRSGIPCSKYWTSQEALNLLDHHIITLPMLKRELRHRDGADITEITTRRQLQQLGQEQRAVKIFDKNQEWRAHIVCGECVVLVEKVLVPSTYKGKQFVKDFAGDPVVWKGDWTNFENRPIKKQGLSKYTPIIGLAKAAISALGYDFGAVDIGTWALGDEKEEYFGQVFEVNLAPVLHDDTAKRYAEVIRRRFEG